MAVLETEIISDVVLNDKMAGFGTTQTKEAPIINIKADARRVFDVLQQGGLAIIPSDVGYGLVATSPTALDRAFNIKQRKPHKRHAMIGSWDLHRAIHVLPSWKAETLETLVKVIDIPLGVVAPFRPDHPLVQKLGAEMLARSSMDGTMAMLINGGKFQDELSRLCTQAGLPLMGSSANLTGKGTKTVVQDIEPEILAAAGIVIDYGKRKYSYPRASSTMINFKDFKLLRFGACYDVVQDVFRKFYGIEFPDDPGQTELFSGHIDEPMMEEGR